LLNPEKAEILGALFGDKRRFKIRKRYGVYKGYDYSKYLRGSLEISLGKDKQWGYHLSELFFKSYGVRGSVYKHEEWTLAVESTRVVKDLAQYYSLSWDCYSWRIPEIILDSDDMVKRRLLRGYFDAEGYSKRMPRCVEAVSVNKKGLSDMQLLLKSIGIHSKIYESRSPSAWRLRISCQKNLLLFRDLINFSIARKSLQLNIVLKNYVVPKASIPVWRQISLSKQDIFHA